MFLGTANFSSLNVNIGTHEFQYMLNISTVNFGTLNVDFGTSMSGTK